MSESMVERVASVICGNHCDMPMCSAQPDADSRAACRHMSLCDARAAIEAMRDPTEAMVIAGVQGPLGNMEARYQAMIDVALAEPLAPTPHHGDFQMSENRGGAQVPRPIPPDTQRPAASPLDAWRNIPIDTHNCHLAITACGELSDEIERLRDALKAMLAEDDGGMAAAQAKAALAKVQL